MAHRSHLIVQDSTTSHHPISFPKRDEDLISWRRTVEERRDRLSLKVERLLALLGLKLNEVTGYKEVERLKNVVHQQESSLNQLRSAARAAKTAYDDAVIARAEAARNVNSLLERKHSWTDADVSMFTSLVRSDHSSNHAVNSTSSKLQEAELAVDKAFTDLTKAILERYHEEQVWSDKIRNVSTWAGVIGLLVNFVVFIGAIAVVEPWKRRRLVERLEQRMSGMMEKMESGVASLAVRIEESASAQTSQNAQPPIDLDVVTGMGYFPHIPAESPTPRWTASFHWLPSSLALAATPSSDRDLIAAGICGVAGGAMAFSMLSWLIRGR